MTWLARMLTVMALSGTLAAAQAASPVGTWKVDPASVSQMMDRLGAVAAARITPEQLAEMRAAMSQMQAQMAEMRKANPAMAEQMEKMMAGMQGAGDDPAAMVRQMLGGTLARDMTDTTLTLAEDGEVLVEEAGPETTRPLRWRWRLDGDEVEISGVDPDEGGTFTLRGPLADDRMTLRLVPTEEMRADAADDPDGLAMLEGLTWDLLRQ